MKKIFDPLFKRVYVPLTYTLPVILAVFAISGGYISVVVIDHILKNEVLLYPGLADDIRKLSDIIKISSLVFLVLAIAIGILLSRIINQAVESIISSQGQIEKGKPLSPVPQQMTGDELEKLTGSFNQMVSRLNSYILDSLMGCTIILDQDTNILSMNASARKTLNVGDDEDVHRKMEDVLGNGGMNADFIQIMKSALKEGMVSSSREVAFHFKGGGAVTLGLTASVLRNQAKEPAGLFVIFKDLTRIKELQLQMQRTEKMISLGRLSASIAHEIRNPLGSIKGLTQLLMERSPEDEKVQRYTGVMIREIERLDRVVQNLLNFANPTEQEFEECDINEVVREAVQLACYKKSQNRPNIEEAYDTSAPHAFAEREKLFQAVLNIVLNALEASGENDRVSVRTRFCANSLFFRQVNDHDGIRVEVSNTGSTIPPEIMEKIFDPFFTTKSEGSGLGLAITQQIISAHNGNLKVDSRDNTTTFGIELPLSRANV